MTDKLTKDEIAQNLNDLTGWLFEAGSIKKVFKTSSYPATMGLVTSIGGICQRLNHHPDYILMKYREIEVSFSTHSAGGITLKDIEAAREIEKISI